MKERLVAWCCVLMFVGVLVHYGPRLFKNPFDGLGVNPVANALPKLPAGCRTVKDCS